MSGLVFRRILSHKWVKVGEQMPQAEREAFLTELDEALHKVGGRRLVFLICDATDALQQWDTLGTEVFPDMRAVQEYEGLLEKLNCSQYIETRTETGTGGDFERWLRGDVHRPDSA